VLPENEQRLRSVINKLNGLPDAIVLDEKSRYLYWVEVKYLQPISSVLMKLDEYSRKLAEKFNIYQSEGRTIIVRIAKEFLSEVMQSIEENVDPFKLKGIIYCQTQNDNQYLERSLDHDIPRHSRLLSIPWSSSLRFLSGPLTTVALL